MKTVLSEFRKRGLVPLSSDAIKDALKPVPTPREAPEFLGQRDCARLLEAVIRHDADTFAMTRAEHGGGSLPGMTFRYVAIGPLVVSALFTGMRFNELLKLKWSDVDLEAKGSDGAVVGEIRLRATATKTKHARTIGLEVSPALRRLLVLLKLRSGGAPYVFGGEKPMTETLANAARLRLSRRFGAPKFSWQMLRRTCGTFLTNAPGIFGAASAYRSAKQLGHSVEVAERHYAGLLRGISNRATSIEAAIGIEGATATMLDSIRGQTSGSALLNAS